MAPLKVISQPPPGGRCTLYARYADAISTATGWSHSVVHSEERDAHGEGFPSLWIREVSVQPEDYFRITAEDICGHLARLGVDAATREALSVRLQVIFDDFVAAAGKAPGAAKS
jgi:cystathionine gamma-synthase